MRATYTFSVAIFSFAISFLCGEASAATVMFEDFEKVMSAREGVVYVPSHADAMDDVLSENYYGVLNLATGADITYSNVQGTDFYGAQDTDSALGGGGPANPVSISWTGINITNTTDLNLSFFVAEDTAADGNEDWDIESSVHVDVQIDGGGFNPFFWVESIDPAFGNRPPAVDTNFDGVGDGAAITDVFTKYSGTIGVGSTLDIQVTFTDLDTGDEDFAIDSVLLTGTVVGVPEPSAFVFLLLGSTIPLLRRRR